MCAHLELLKLSNVQKKEIYKKKKINVVCKIYANKRKIFALSHDDDISLLLVMKPLYLFSFQLNISVIAKKIPTTKIKKEKLTKIRHHLLRP